MTELEKKLEFLNEMIADMEGDSIVSREKLIKALIKAIEQRDACLADYKHHRCPASDEEICEMKKQDNQELLEILK